MKKALLYNPYLDVIGGGEKHILSIMNVLAQSGYSIDVAWDDAGILERVQDGLRADVSAFTCVPNVFRANDRGKRDALTARYDIFVYVTDGSYFFTKAKRNFIFAMYPDKRLFSSSPLNWLKLRNYEVIANGEFTAEKVSAWLKKPVHTAYPYIDPTYFVDKVRKDQVILSVGRFFQHLHAKRQDILIQAFTKLQQDYREFRDFTLVLAGGLKDEDKEYYAQLQELAKMNHNIIFKPNVAYSELQSTYKNAMFYWHAAGFGIDESEHPERVEHVGISPLEAMASKCLVICHDSGGPKRYIAQGQNGYLYTSVDDLVAKTAQGYIELQRSDRIIDNGRLYVGTHFSYPVFKNKVEQIFTL